VKSLNYQIMLSQEIVSLVESTYMKNPSAHEGFIQSTPLKQMILDFFKHFIVNE
jgi:hypothetical protein